MHICNSLEMIIHIKVCRSVCLSRNCDTFTGYYGTKVAAEDKVLENSMESVRKEIERFYICFL